MLFENKKFLVYGLQKSGLASIEYIANNGGEVYCYDDNKGKISDIVAVKKLYPGSVHIAKDAEILSILDKVNTIILSPGIGVDNKIVRLANEKNIEVICEVELSSRHFPCEFIGVTGTNGKSTTSTLISKILTENGKNSPLLGNIGVPTCQELPALIFSDVPTLELSSYQLELCTGLSPRIAVFLNLYEDHLARHLTMENYFKIKSRIFKNQTGDDIAILNYDDKKIRELHKSIKSQVYYFSTTKKCYGAYLDGDNFKVNISGTEKTICGISDLKIFGSHNYQNVLASILVASLVGISNEDIKKAFVVLKG